MILSNVEIHKALDQGWLVIDPRPEPRFPVPGSDDCPYATTSVDLRLSPELVVPTQGTFVIDVTQPGSFAETLSRNSKTYQLTDEQPYHLKPNQFVLGRTLEYVKLPLKGPIVLAARIEGKSSRARCGLLVHFTAPTVHAGFEGTLTLEMINLSNSTFVLRPKMAIAQLIIEQVLGIPERNPSQFQGQTAPQGVVGKPNE